MSTLKFSREQLALLAKHMVKEDTKLSSIQPVAREATDKHFPLSFAQQRLWFLDQLQPGSPAYNIAIAYRINGKLNIAAIEQCINEIVRRHEVLRAIFKTIDGQPVQVIVPNVTIKLIVENLEPFSDEQREVEMQQRTIAEGREPFSLAMGPLLRSRVLRLNETEYILLLTAHHIVFDGWSMSLFYQELATLYDAYIQGEPSPLPELPIQYVDFAYWQREWLQGEMLEAEISYWKQQLTGAPAVLELPSDRPRPATQTLQGELYSFVFPKTLTRALEVLSRQEDCTLFQTLLAAFHVLLYRYTGQHDIVIGSPIANRNHVELEALIGFFANTLPIRVDLSGDPTFLELLSRVREITLDAYTHQELPLEKLVDELHLQRDLSYAPLVQILFVLQNISNAKMRLANLNVEPLEISNGTTKFDLSLEMIEIEGHLKGSIQYSIDLFDSATIARMIECFQTLLEGIVSNSHCPISVLPLLSSSERQQLLMEWNATEAGYEYNQCIHHLFEEQALRTPHAKAIVFEERYITYQTLNERANQLAHYLLSQGVEAEHPVGISMERSFEMVVGLLGILKAGGVCVPLDPDYPQQRLAFMLDDAQVKILLIQPHLLERFPAHQATIICLDASGSSLASYSANPLTCPVDPEQAAYVIYTSGSTGIPKGVMLPHRSLCNRLLWGQNTFPLTVQDRVLQEASFSFDFAIWEFFAPLMVGAQVILARPTGQRDLEYLLEVIEEQTITVLHLIPSLLRVFLEQPRLEERCRSVRHVYAGAEALPLELWQRFTQRLDAHLHNVYGPTEATIDSTCWTGEQETEMAFIPIGQPISNVQVYLLDAQEQPVPQGARGEIYLAGAGLTRGYLNHPELTAERFLPHPFSQEPGARLYRTGDLARYHSDGMLEYLGRVDTQVKVRGFRIELGEVERVLKEHPQVHDALVVVREERPGERRLVAYVQGRQGPVPQGSEVRSFMQKQLPEYMVPALFMMVDTFPLLPTGKIDRENLPVPDAQGLQLERSYIAPRTLAEQKLARVWAQVLGIERIGIHDNYFELGGDSIRSVQIIAHAKTVGLTFSVQQLFRHQTIAELIEASKLSGNNFEILPCTKPFDLLLASDRRRIPADVEDAYPLTAMQKGMLYHMDMTVDLPGAPDYHNVDSFYYRAPFHLSTFQEAVNRCVQRHPMLRTSFDLTSYSESLQLVHPTGELIVQEEDIRDYDTIEQEQIISQFVEREQRNHFDMSRPTLMRFHIHRRTDDSFQFTLTEYHPIIDGWSIHSILAEIFTTYFRLLDGTDPGNDEPIATSFRDYVAAEAMSLESEICQKYWERKLADHSRLQLPTWTSSSVASPEDQRYRKITVSIPLDLSEELRQLARENNVSLKSLLFAVHVKVMNLLSGQTDILTGQLSNGRLEVIDGERVVGLFLNILPLRLQINGGSWLDLMHQAFEAESEVMPYRRYPLAELQSRWGGRTPLLNTVFSYFDFHVFNDMFHQGKIEHLGQKILSHNVGFVLNTLFFASSAEYKTNEIYFDIAYEAARLTEQDALQIGEYYVSIMKAMLGNPQSRYDQTNVLPPEETQKLLMEWNATSAEYNFHYCLHQLFEKQVERTPDTIAIILDTATRTYRELNDEANRLAHHLQESGVMAETMVGISMERSFEMVVGLLGILKAGGVCVPLDPDYPQQRLAFMLDDAQVKILLIQPHLLERFPAHQATIICLDASGSSLASYSANPLTCPVDPEQAAYVIYTSGSTGIPKGVMLPHRSLCNRLLWGQNTFPLTVQDRVLQEASFSFDFAIWEFFAPLMVGAQVILARPTGQRDLEYLLEVIEEQTITVLHLIPSLLRVFLEQPRLEERCRSVRHVYAGAEALPLELWQRFTQRLDAHLHNVYGPTEATIDSTCWTGEQETEMAFIPIGQPISNVQVYLLDAQEQPVPQGARGEIYLAGAGLTRGYLNHPELTAERFLPHPFSQEPGARLYRTGDLARYHSDGMLEYLGRVDTQVKVRGFRIELGEVERVLKEHPQVHDALVVVREERPGERRLVAYVQGRQGPVPQGSEVRSFMQKQLPEYMVPALFMMVDTFPLLPTGKIDRENLPVPDAQGLQLEKSYIAPQGPLEQILVYLWEDLLGQTHISIDDDFFELGGDSLLVIQLVAWLRAGFHIKITPQDILEIATTVASLADIIRSRRIEIVGKEAFENSFAGLEHLSGEEAWETLLENDELSPVQ